MKRLFWLTVGVTVGALVVRKLSQQAARITPKGLTDEARKQAAGLGDSIRAFAEDVRAGIAQRENELHDALIARDHGGGHNGHNGNGGIDPEAAARLARDPEARWSEGDGRPY